MKNYFYVYMLTFSLLCCADEQVTKEVTVDQGVMKFSITNKVENNNNHKISVSNDNKEDPYDCTKYIGDELKARMAYLPKERVADNLIKFADRTREKYRESLTVQETKELLAALDSQERDKLLKNLGTAGQNFIYALEYKLTKAQEEQDANNRFWGRFACAYPFLLFLI